MVNSRMRKRTSRMRKHIAQEYHAAKALATLSGKNLPGECPRRKHHSVDGRRALSDPKVAPLGKWAIYPASTRCFSYHIETASMAWFIDAPVMTSQPRTPEFDPHPLVE
tara:strand:- start:1626 stop:1952 length:327 start_codon:yes stop_codon:yes gene_type:complete